MDADFTRRQWLITAPVLAMAAGSSTAQNSKSTYGQEGSKAAGSSGPALHGSYPARDPDLVREIVGASHGRIERVRALLEQSATLARCCWDWGFGDFETPLGAASHVGRRDIAELLIRYGARPNIFTFAMLGHLDAVKAMITAMPDVAGITGPHGLTLLHHSRVGGKEAEAVRAYLESLGNADPQVTDIPLTDDQKQNLVGRYRYGRGDSDVFDVEVDRRGRLAIRSETGSARPMNQVEMGVFSPAGTDQVRISFESSGGHVVKLTIRDVQDALSADRIN